MTSYYGGHGPMLNGVLWAQVVVCTFFVSLRIYTRSRILHSIGPDDYLVLLALVYPHPHSLLPKAILTDAFTGPPDNLLLLRIRRNKIWHRPSLRRRR